MKKILFFLLGGLYFNCCAQADIENLNQHDVLKLVLCKLMPSKPCINDLPSKKQQEFVDSDNLSISVAAIYACDTPECSLRRDCETPEAKAMKTKETENTMGERKIESPNFVGHYCETPEVKASCLIRKYSHPTPEAGITKVDSIENLTRNRTVSNGYGFYYDELGSPRASVIVRHRSSSQDQYIAPGFSNAPSIYDSISEEMSDLGKSTLDLSVYKFHPTPEVALHCACPASPNSKFLEQSKAQRKD